MCFSLVTTAFASSPDEADESTDNKENSVALTEKSLSLTAEDKAAYSAYGESLALKLRDCATPEYEKIIFAYCAANSNPVFEKVLAAVQTNQRKGSALKLSLSEDLYTKYEETYELSEKAWLTVAPTYIVVSTLDTHEGKVNAGDTLRGTSSTSGKCTETYYGIVGNKLFSLTVECEFYYNGQKAWYKSGFDYYYTKGFLSIWQVSNWKGWKEASGTSYKAYCAGNFHYGLEYEGNGWVIQDLYCKNTLTCSKDGTISRSATMS